MGGLRLKYLGQLLGCAVLSAASWMTLVEGHWQLLKELQITNNWVLGELMLRLELW